MLESSNIVCICGYVHISNCIHTRLRFRLNIKPSQNNIRFVFFVSFCYYCCRMCVQVNICFECLYFWYFDVCFALPAQYANAYIMFSAALTNLKGIRNGADDCSSFNCVWSVLMAILYISF